MILLKHDVVDKGEKSRVVQIRMTKKEYVRLKQKAALYAEGNVSLYVRAALHKFKPDVTVTPR